MLRLSSFYSNLPFQYPFTIAKGTKTHQPALVVALSFGKLSGWGEAPAISYYGITVEQMQASLAQARRVIESYSLTDPHRFWHFLHHLLPGQHFLIAALDIAAWDLFSRLRKKPLYAALGLPFNPPIPCDYTIGLDGMEQMVEKLKSHTAPAYKIKLAKPEDIDLLRELRKHSEAAFRVDVNEGWNYDDTLRLLPDLQKLGVVLVEQPLPANAWEEMEAIKSQSPLPVFADESCVNEEDISRCAKAFHGVNIKLTKCGGITPAMRMISEGRKLGLSLMLGSMNECSIGTAAVVNMSAAVDYLDADGPLLLAEDHASGLMYDKGFISINGTTGLGVEVNTSQLQAAL